MQNLSERGLSKMTQATQTAEAKVPSDIELNQEIEALKDEIEALEEKLTWKQANYNRESKIATIPEAEGVIVSPIEPIKNRRKYWHQKGKNLFNYRSAKYINGYIDVDFQNIRTSNEHKLTYVKVDGNTTYTISKQAGTSFRIATFEEEPAIGIGYLQTMADHTATSITITTVSKAKYLAFVCFVTGNDTGTYIDMYKTIMVEEGSTATTYEDYINKIYIKNDYGEYEEIKPKINVITGVESETGLLVSGKVEYRKRIDCGTLPNNTSLVVNTGLSNVTFTRKPEGFAQLTAGGSNTMPLPYIDPRDTTASISLSIISEYRIAIVTSQDRTSLNGFVDVFYVKD